MIQEVFADIVIACVVLAIVFGFFVLYDVREILIEIRDLLKGEPGEE